MKQFSLEDFLNPEDQNEGIKRNLRLIHRNGEGKRPIRRLRDPVESRLLIQAILDTIRKEEQEGNLIRKGRTWFVR